MPPFGEIRIDPVYAPTFNPVGLTLTVNWSGVLPLVGATVNHVVFGVVTLKGTGEEPEELDIVNVCVAGATPACMVKVSDGLSDEMLPVAPVGTV